MLKHHMANQCTKFEMSSFSHSGDILGGIKKFNGSRDHNHVPFGVLCVGSPALVEGGGFLTRRRQALHQT